MPLIAFVDLGLLGGFRGKPAAQRTVEDLIGKVRGLLANEPSVSNLRSDEHA